MRGNTKWTIGIILTILGLLITIGFFNYPNIILVRQYNSDYTCPNILYSPFDVTFSNKGNADTSLCVYVTSPNKNISFEKDKDCLYASSGEQTQFGLEINKSSISKLSNVTINYNYLYKKRFFMENHTISCFYVRENYWETLNLKSQEILN